MQSRPAWRPIAAVLSLVTTIVLAACGASEWRTLEVSEGAFSVLMPRDPRYVKQDVDTPAGRMTAHLYSSDRPGAYLAVGYADYPLALVAGSTPDALFAGVRNTWIKRINGRLVGSDNPITLEGKYRGLEFTAEGTSPRSGKAAAADPDGKPAADDTYLQARLYMVDQRLYQVIAMGRKSEMPQGTVNRYLNSFKLIPQSETGTLRIDPAGK